MNDIMTGKKRYVRNDEIKKAFCPQIEGLYMADLVGFIAERRALHEYFPDMEEIPKQGKQWVKNMLRILCEEEFRAWVSQRCQQHNQRGSKARHDQCVLAILEVETVSCAK